MTEVSRVNFTPQYQQAGGYELEDVRRDNKAAQQTLGNFNQDIQHLDTNGNLTKAQQDEIKKMLQKYLAESGQNLDEDGQRAGGKKGGGGAKSWLQAIAQAMGKIADQKAAELQALSDSIGNGNNEPSQMLKFQTLAAEFQQMMSTFTGVIKSIAEGLSAPPNAAKA